MALWLIHKIVMKDLTNAFFAVIEMRILCFNEDDENDD